MKEKIKEFLIKFKEWKKEGDSWIVANITLDDMFVFAFGAVFATLLSLFVLPISSLIIGIAAIITKIYLNDYCKTHIWDIKKIIVGCIGVICGI